MRDHGNHGHFLCFRDTVFIRSARVFSLFLHLHAIIRTARGHMIKWVLQGAVKQRWYGYWNGANGKMMICLAGYGESFSLGISFSFHLFTLYKVGLSLGVSRSPSPHYLRVDGQDW